MRRRSFIKFSLTQFNFYAVKYRRKVRILIKKLGNKEPSNL